MKLNKLFSFSMLTFLLIGCGPASSIKKVVFDYVENAKLVEISGQDLYNLTIINKKSLAVFYSVEGCAMCNDLKQQMQGFAVKQHCNMYYVDMTNIQEDDYNQIVEATRYANTAYEFPAYGTTLSLPFMHIFAYQGVVWSFNDQFIDFLFKYTETSHA